MVAANVANLQRGGNEGNQNANKGKTNVESATFVSGVSQTDAGTMLNVHRASVNKANKVKKDGSASLVKAVEQGEVTVNTAKDLATLPKEEQEETVKAGPKAVAARVREIRSDMSISARIFAAPPLRLGRSPVSSNLRSPPDTFPTALMAAGRSRSLIVKEHGL